MATDEWSQRTSHSGLEEICIHEAGPQDRHPQQVQPLAMFLRRAVNMSSFKHEHH